jgi:toxin ParE1/3/4
LIRGYIRKFNPMAAESTVTRILETVHVITEQPHIGRAGRDSLTREFIVSGTPYIIVYMVHDVVEIVAVLHGAQIH